MKRLMLSMAIFFYGTLASAQIIDLHTHLTSDAKIGTKFHVNNLIQSMDQAGVDRSVVLSMAYGYFAQGQRLQAEAENNFVANTVSKQAKRLIGFCSVPIMASWALEEIERCKNTLKLKGLKIHPNNSQLHVRDSIVAKNLEKIFILAEKLNLPIVIDSSWMDSQGTYKILRLAMERPNLKIVLAHAFFTHFRDLFFVAAIYQLYPMVQNLYVDISAIINMYVDHPERDLLVWHLRKFGIDRVMFGSDYPLYTQAQALEALRKYPFTQEELNLILTKNFQKIIQL